MKRVRVLRAMDKLGYDNRLHGPGRMWLKTLPRFDVERFEIIPVVLRLHPGLDGLFEQHGIDLINFKRGRLDVRAVADFCRVIERRKIDVLHVSGFGSSTFGRLAGLWMKKPVIVHQHDFVSGPPLIFKLVDRLLAPATTQAVAVSRGVADFCIRDRFIAAGRVTVIPNAIDSDWAECVNEPAVAELKKKFSIEEGDFVVGTVTRLYSPKGLPLLLEAISLLLEKDRPIKVVIVGDGEERDKIEKWIHEEGLAGSVFLTGYQNEVRPYLALMDAFAFPSKSEGFGTALLEAMAVGKPVIATDVDGMRELVRDGENGLLVPPADAVALARAIEYLRLDPAAARRIGQQALEDSQSYLMPAHIEKIEKLYLDAVKADVPAGHGFTPTIAGPDSGIAQLPPQRRR